MDLRDKLKFWMALSNYVDMIVRGTSPLSLPDAITNSLSYVKAFGGTEQRNLPDGYTQLEYIGTTGTQYIDTGVLGSDVTAFELKGTIAASGGQNTQFIGGTNQAATSFFGARAMSSTITWYCMTARGSSIGDPSHVCVITSTIESASSQPGTLYDTETGTTTEYAKFASATWGFDEENILLFGGSETRRSPNATCYYLKLYTANGLAFYGIPVKNSSNAVGLYDLVSGTFFANSGTGDFVAGPETVPTPDAPMDIVSNNGVLKARHQSGLPLGYTLLDYIESDGTQYIDTGVKTGSATSYGYDLTYQYTELLTGSANGVTLVGIRQTNPEGGWGNLYWANYNGFTHGRGIYGGLPNTVIQYFEDATNTTTVYTTSFDANKTTRAWSITDSVSGSFSGTLDRPFDCSDLNVYLFRFNPGTQTPSQLPKVRVYSFIMRVDGNVVRDYIPARRESDGVLGMYDLVNDAFYQNAGTGTFTAGTAVSDPVEIYTDGTVETINVHGKNLFDKNASYALFSGYLKNTSVGQSTILLAYDGGDKTIIIKVAPNTTYTVTRATNLGSVYDRIRCAAFTTLPVDGSTGVILYNLSSNTQQANVTFTTLSDTQYVAINVRNSGAVGDDWAQYIDAFQLELGSTATEYQPYYNGGTATAEMLLKVGDYQDVQSVIDGAITRNVGVKVLDGTEDWRASSTYQGSCYINNPDAINNVSLLCTHFVSATQPSVDYARGKCLQNGTDLSLWYGDNASTAVAYLKQFLSDQYAAGTPVTVIYPLAQAGTEQVAPQVLNVQTGDNILEITQASLSNLELEAKYEKEA